MNSSKGHVRSGLKLFLAAAIVWLKNRDYLPKVGKDYTVKPWEISCGDWSATWYGIKPADRGRVLESTVDDLRALWAGGHADFELPFGPVQAKVPIWIAAGIYHPEDPLTGAQAAVSNSVRGRWVARRLDRVARLADGWMTLMAEPDEIRSDRANEPDGRR